MNEVILTYKYSLHLQVAASTYKTESTQGPSFEEAVQETEGGVRNKQNTINEKRVTASSVTWLVS